MAPPNAARDADRLTLEAGWKDYCEREVDEVEWQGGRLYLHLRARSDDLPAMIERVTEMMAAKSFVC